MSEVSIQIQILHVPDCPLVDGVRTTLRRALAQVQLHATASVEERVGDYLSPTLLIDGRDVTGRPQDQHRGGACRLDLPTEAQVLAALERLTSAGHPQPPAARLQPQRKKAAAAPALTPANAANTTEETLAADDTAAT